jgi:uncharacterized protein (DUF983 family)
MAVRWFLRALADGGRLRCPACRAGRMSPGRYRFFSMHDACPACGIPFTPGRGESVGGVEIATYATALLGLVGVMTLAILRAPLWELAIFAVGFGTIFPILVYRHAKGLWVGAMYGALAWSVAGDAPHEAPIRIPWGES